MALSAKREFGGATEGSGSPSNEREGAFRGSGTLFFSTTCRVDTLFAEGSTQWGGASSYDVSRPYTASNWSSAIRFASAGGANVEWDNVTVATTFGEAVPETSVSLLGLLGAATLLRRRRN